MPQLRLNNLTIGSIGLFYVCYRLAQLNWWVEPAERRKGSRIQIFSQDESRSYIIVVRASKARNSVLLGKRLDRILAGVDYVVICQFVIHEAPECYILTSDEV